VIRFIVIFCIYAQNLSQISLFGRSYGYICKIQNTAAAIFVLVKMMILVTLSNSGWHSAPAHQVWWESAHRRRRNVTFMKSKMAVTAILYTITFNTNAIFYLLGRHLFVVDRVRFFPSSTATSFLGRTRSFGLGICVNNNILKQILCRQLLIYNIRINQLLNRIQLLQT